VSPFALSYVGLWGEANVRLLVVRTAAATSKSLHVDSHYGRSRPSIPPPHSVRLTRRCLAAAAAHQLPTAWGMEWVEWVVYSFVILMDFQSILCGFKCVDLVHIARHGRCSASLGALTDQHGSGWKTEIETET